MSNVDINVDGRTENRTPISHPATSRCNKNRLANSVAPDETACYYKPSHLDLPCLHRCLFWSTGLKGIKEHVSNNVPTN